MKLEIKSNFSFTELSNNLPNILEKQTRRITRSSAEGIKKNIGKGLSPSLKKSTLEIRKFRGISGSKPLFATGALKRSIKGTKDGIQMLEYGLHQHRGFTPKKIPFQFGQVSKKRDYLAFAHNKKGIKVPARPFIFPSQKTILKSIDAFKKDLRKGMRK